MDFEGRIRRLKECLGLAEDQEVARALGLTKAALSDRRKRGSFPEGKVIAAKARYPGLDVHYVLTGLREQGHAAAVIERATAHAAKGNHPDRARLEAGLAAHGAKEAEVHMLLPYCDDDALDLLIRLAARLASTAAKSRPAPNVAPPAAPKAQRGAGVRIDDDTHYHGPVGNVAGRDIVSGGDVRVRNETGRAKPSKR